MSTISAGTTSTTALVSTGDTTGNLILATGATPTTALTLNSTTQAATFAGAVTAPSVTSSGTVNALNTFGFENRLINGAMMIDQRNAGASVTITATAYTLDRWQAYCGGVASKFSVQQNAASVTPPTGFINYLGCTSLSAYSVLTSDRFGVNQSIEGLNAADLAWGTASAKTVTLSFWVRSSLTGTFGGSVQNYGATRSYPFTYTVSAANTWEQKSITIAGDTSGTWLTTNSGFATINFSIGTGATYSGTASAWATADYRSATGATSVVGTNGATFYITGVQLEVGSQATSFDFRDYGRELLLCQRYFEKIGYNMSEAPGATSGYNGALLSVPLIVSGAFTGFTWQVAKRAAATVTTYGSIAGATETSGIVCDWNFGTSLGAATVQRATSTNCNYISSGASTYGAIYRATISAEL